MIWAVGVAAVAFFVLSLALLVEALPGRAWLAVGRFSCRRLERATGLEWMLVELPTPTARAIKQMASNTENGSE